jgi:hypothetical protein
MSTVSSLRNEQGRQKLSDRETTEQTKQVKPVGIVQRAEPFPARDNGKCDVGTWEAVFARENMQAALKRVESNKGAAGVDGMKVEDLRGYLKMHWLEVREALESGKYRPSPVRRVEIPKPEGGVRQLGIPTVQDRLIQQAIAQVLSPMYEQEFSPYSYGFRSGRSAHQAIQKSQEYIREGYDWVVDIDLEKFFDRVNHEWKRWKRGTTRYRELVRLGVPKERAALGAIGTSPWRMSRTPVIHEALNNAYWRNAGLESIAERNYVILIEPPAKRADPHVRWCERERLIAAPYSICKWRDRLGNFVRPKPAQRIFASSRV